jgi:hypothetical protein
MLTQFCRDRDPLFIDWQSGSQAGRGCSIIYFSSQGPVVASGMVSLLNPLGEFFLLANAFSSGAKTNVLIVHFKKTERETSEANGGDKM